MREKGSTIFIGGKPESTQCGHSFVTCHTDKCFRKEKEMNTYLIYDSANQAHEVKADYFINEENGNVLFFRAEENIMKGHIASFYHPVSVVLKGEETIKEAPPVSRSEEGKRVSVYDGDQGLPLFHGTTRVSQYPGWHRIVPDSGYIDLPRRFKVVPR